MSRIFRDAVNPAAIPLAGCDGVFAYANGDFAWTAQDIRNFRRAGKQIARIDVNGSAWQLASILDVERFDATPATAKIWVPKRNEFRGDAAIYCGKDNLEPLFTALAGEVYSLIVADWTGKPHRVNVEMPPGVDYLGTQYLHEPGYDATVLYANDWHPR